MSNNKDDDDDDAGAMWRDIHDQRQLKREQNRTSSIQFLEKQGVPFQLKNGGAHAIIKIGDININFWPGTGLWHSEAPFKMESRGVFNLLAFLEQRAWRTRLATAVPPMPAPLSTPTSAPDNMKEVPPWE